MPFPEKTSDDSQETREVRGLRWIIFPALAGAGLVMLLGLTHTRGNSAREIANLQNDVPAMLLASLGPIFGALAGAVLGSLIWALFPYKNRPGSQDSEDKALK